MDSRERERFIEAHRPLALSVLKHLGHGGDEDLEQVAMLGLVRAADRFDPSCGFRFSTYALPTMVGEIKHYLRDRARMVRPPRSLSDLHSAVLAKEAELARRSGAAPTLAEIARALEVDLDQVVEAMAMDDVCRPASLDAMLLPLESDQAVALQECLGAPDPEMERVETRTAWESVLDRLPALLRQVIELRYYQNLTQIETARRMGVSQMQVSRLERRALARLRGDLSPIVKAIAEEATATGCGLSSSARD